MAMQADTTDNKSRMRVKVTVLHVGCVHCHVLAAVPHMKQAAGRPASTSCCCTAAQDQASLQAPTVILPTVMQGALAK